MIGAMNSIGCEKSDKGKILMSYVPITSTVGTAAAAAAAARARKEEEEMTKYNSDDLEGWEFKIMRSTWGHFGKREKFQKICDEEAVAGWEMVEKFDNYRVRFKRRIERRSNDRHMQTDPYRTSPGSGGSAGKLGLILGITLALLGVLFFLVNATGGAPLPWTMITAVGLGVIFIGMTVLLKKR